MAKHTEQTAHFAEFTTQMLTLNTFFKNNRNGKHFRLSPLPHVLDRYTA